jgi:nucleoprotein TPR
LYLFHSFSAQPDEDFTPSRSELKEKLNQETDSNRQLSLRRDFDNKTYQDRIDKLTSDYSSTRESLLVAQNSQEHLQQRVTDLVEQISSKEEKLAIYEGRTSTSGASADSNMTLEQQLQVEVIGLR